MGKAKPMRNLITDVPGLKVGHAQDARLASGATVIVFDQPAVAAADVRGGAPGTRETDLLAPGMLVEHVDAIALSGGSAFGLDTASGVQAWLREQGRGFAVGTARVPIVPGAVMFDLHNGGDKDWGRYSPYRELGYAAAAAADLSFALGSVGAGLGVRTVNFKGGTGSASAPCDGCTVGALAAVNAVGSVVVDDGPWFWAAPFEQGKEFGGRGFPSPVPPGALDPRTKGAVRANTTLVVRDQQTVVIGGLMQNDKASSENKIPILGDIPVLGNLFKRKIKSGTKNELLIFLTPHIIPAPTELVAMTSEEKRHMLTPHSYSEEELDRFLDKMPTKKPSADGKHN